MTVAEFLLALARDSELLLRFVEEPERVVKESGLGETQRKLLLSGNLRELRVKITAEIEIDGEMVAFHTVYKPPPPPPPPPTKN
jgi:hypothetical protein